MMYGGAEWKLLAVISGQQAQDTTIILSPALVCVFKLQNLLIGAFQFCWGSLLDRVVMQGITVQGRGLKCLRAILALMIQYKTHTRLFHGIVSSCCFETPIQVFVSRRGFEVGNKVVIFVMYAWDPHAGSALTWHS